MAAPTSLALLRRLIDEPTTATYADDELNSRLSDAVGDRNVVALEVWQEKMSAAASLVNTSEGGSSRSMSQAFDHAQAMVEHFQSLVGGTTRIRKLTRPKAS